MTANFKEAVSDGLLFTVIWVLGWTFVPLASKRIWSWSGGLLLGLSSGLPAGFLFALITYLRLQRRSKKQAEQKQ